MSAVRRLVNSTVLFLVAWILIQSVQAADTPEMIVRNWREQIQSALTSGFIKKVELRWSGWAGNPESYVAGSTMLTAPSEVRSILESIVANLQSRNFEITDVHNLATYHVSFVFQMPTICKTESQGFIVNRTMADHFYIGCGSEDIERQDSGQRLRIRSASLDRALQNFFPKELAAHENSER